MIKVFCVDIGYSLKSECNKWEENECSYPGQALYGVNHFKKFGVEPVFEWCDHGYFYGQWYAIIDEFIKFVSLLRYRKEYDILYIPHAYYSRWIILLKKMKLIRKPIVVCMHNKNNLRELIRACDYVITINPALEKILKEQYPNLKIKYIPLLPEKNNHLLNRAEKKYDIISIGNTQRDYQTLVEAMRGLPYTCLIVTAQTLRSVPENVIVVNKNLQYSECLELYMQSEIIVIPIVEAAVKGVFGLTSLVDALYVGKPVIVTRTTGMGIPVKKNNFGLEVEAGSSDSMREAIIQLMSNQEQRKVIAECIQQTQKYCNMEVSAKEICKIFSEIMEK